MKQSTKIITAVLSTIILAVFCCFIGIMCFLGILGYIEQSLAPTELKDGFSDKWLAELSGRYHLHIPKSAVYLKGLEHPGQDSNVYMLFTIDAADFNRMFGDSWQPMPPCSPLTTCDELDPHHILKHSYMYKRTLYTYLYFSEADKNHKITCCFWGWRPFSDQLVLPAKESFKSSIGTQEEQL